MCSIKDEELFFEGIVHCTLELKKVGYCYTLTGVSQQYLLCTQGMVGTEVDLQLNPVQLKTVFGRTTAGRNIGSFIKPLPDSSSEQTAVLVLSPRGQWIKLANLSGIWSENLSGRGETVLN